MGQPIVRLALAFTTQEATQSLASTLATSLLLARAGVAATSLVQGEPLLALTISAPFVGLWLDGRSAAGALRIALGAMSVRALGFLWFDVRWYAVLTLLDVILQPAIVSAYSFLMPAHAAGRDLGRTSGLVTMLTNVARAAGAFCGPLIGFHLGTGGFVVVAAGHLAAALFASSLSNLLAQRPREQSLSSNPSLLRGLSEGLRALAATREDRRVIGLLVLAGLGWGLMDVIALRIAEGTLGGSSQWMKNNAEWNRMDDHAIQFYQRVRAGYLVMVKQEPHRWVVVDSGQKWESVQAELRKVIMERIKAK